MSFTWNPRLLPTKSKACDTSSYSPSSNSASTALPASAARFFVRSRLSTCILRLRTGRGHGEMMRDLDGVLIDTDVLVIGGGAGGLLAALSAKRHGARGTRVTM